MTSPAVNTTRPAPLIPSLPTPAWVVLGGDFISAVGSGLTLPFLLVYLHQVRGLAYAQAGLVLSTVALASLAGNPIGGALADRCGPRPALRLGLAAAAAGSVAVAGVHSAVEAFAAAALLGLGASIAWPAQDALLATLVDPADRSAVFSVRHATLNAGLGLGALVAAVIVKVSHPTTFEAVYLIDAASFMAYIAVLSAVHPARPPSPIGPDPTTVGYRDVLKDKVFLRVWAMTALAVLISYGQYHSGFPGYAVRPGHITARALSLAFAANTFTVVGAQLFVLRRLSGHRRTTGVALAAGAWALTWALVLTGGHLGRGTGAAIAFAVAMVVFALGECLLSPTLAPLINDLAPAEGRGRYNGLGALAYTAGFLIGPATAGVALGAGWSSWLFLGLIIACGLTAHAARHLARHLPPETNTIGR
jgi:MFS family permease